MIARRISWWKEKTRDLSGELTIPTWNGRLTVQRQHSFMAKGLYVRRAYERATITNAVRLIQDIQAGTQRDTLLDVGANLGMISIAFVRHGFCQHAIAIEPAPGNFRLLQHNIVQNGLDNQITAHHMAFSDEAATLTMELDPRNCGADRVLTVDQANRPAHRERVAVPALPFDSFVSQEHCDPERLALVWLDIEGHEARFFRGAQRLKESRTPVVMEFSPRFVQAGGVPVPEFFEILQDYASEFFDLRRRKPVRQSVASLPRLFSELDRPDKISAADLLLIPRRR